MRLYAFLTAGLLLMAGCAKDMLCPDSEKGLLYMRPYLYGAYPVVELESGQIVGPVNLEDFLDLDIVDADPIPVYLSYERANSIYNDGPPRVRALCFRLR